MSKKEHIRILQSKIINTSFWGKVVHGFLCNMRMAPNYYFFCRNENWGDIEFFSNLLYKLRKNIESLNILDSSSIINNLEYLDSITPDTEDFGEIYASHALDSCISLSLLLRYLKEKDEKLILQISDYSIETIYMHLKDSKPTISDSKIFSNILMVKEMTIQECQLNYLENKEDYEIKDLLAKLLALQFNYEKGNILLK